MGKKLLLTQVLDCSADGALQPENRTARKMAMNTRINMPFADGYAAFLLEFFRLCRGSSPIERAMISRMISELPA